MSRKPSGAPTLFFGTVRFGRNAHVLLVGLIAQTCDGILIWGRPYVLAVVGVIMFFANNLNGADYGITACLTNLLGPIVASIPLWVTIFLGLAIAAVVTNFCSNAVAAVAVCSRFIPAMLGVGVDSATALRGNCCPGGSDWIVPQSCP